MSEPPEQRQIVTDDGVRLALRMAGPSAGQVLVLASSLGTTAEMWRPQLDELAATHRVIRFDTRGHGGSEVAPGPYTLARLGRDVLSILDALGVARAHFAGVSLGGMIGQWLGANAGDRLDRLVLANTSAYMGPPASWDARIERVTSEGIAAIADTVVDRWFTPRFRQRAPETIAEVRAMLLATQPAGYAACCAAIRDMDLRSSTSSIRVPTLVIAGSADTATPPSVATEIADAVRGAKLVTLDAAHLSNLEQPEAFTRAVMEHLA